MNIIEEFDDFGELEKVGTPSVKIKFRENLINKWLAVSEVDDIPPYNIFESDVEKICIADIGIFADQPDNIILRQLYGLWRQKNIVKKNNDIKIKDVEQLGYSMLRNGKFPYSVIVARLKDDGSYQCLCGFEYIIFLSILYGVNIKIPVVAQEMSLGQAKKAFDFINNNDNIETVENNIKKQTHASNKIEDLCETMFLDNKNNFKFDFSIGIGKGRKKGTLASFTAIKKFWKEAVGYRGNMKKNLSLSIDFLNAVVARGFEKRHLKLNPIIALGKIYKNIKSEGKDPLDCVDELAGKMLTIDNIDKQKTKDILKELA